jgi:hypothetical protein
MVDAAPSKSLLVNGSIEPVSKSPLVMSSAEIWLELDEDEDAELATDELEDSAPPEEVVAPLWLLAFDEEAEVLVHPASASAVPTKTNRMRNGFIFVFSHKTLNKSNVSSARKSVSLNVI